MIVWSGRGYLPIIVLIVTLFTAVSIIPTEYADYGFIITAFITGIFSWYFGIKWNTKNERIVIDEKTGQRLRIKNNHTLFWIPMQYWGIIFSVFGIVILLQNSVIYGVITAILLLAILLISFVNKRGITANNREDLVEKRNETKPQVKNSTHSSAIISELKKESSNKKSFEPSDHSKFMPK